MLIDLSKHIRIVGSEGYPCSTPAKAKHFMNYYLFETNYSFKDIFGCISEAENKVYLLLD